jgi:hypothetical protein
LEVKKLGTSAGGLARCSLYITEKHPTAVPPP